MSVSIFIIRPVIIRTGHFSCFFLKLQHYFRVSPLLILYTPSTTKGSKSISFPYNFPLLYKPIFYTSNTWGNYFLESVVWVLKCTLQCHFPYTQILWLHYFRHKFSIRTVHTRPILPSESSISESYIDPKPVGNPPQIPLLLSCLCTPPRPSRTLTNLCPSKTHDQFLIPANRPKFRTNVQSTVWGFPVRETLFNTLS